MGFQDELKQNLRTPEVVEKEKEEKEYEHALSSATYTLYRIKERLIDNAKNAKYTLKNGVATISFVYTIDQKFFLKEEKDNSEEYHRNYRAPILFIDTNIKYRSWFYFRINPEYEHEYDLYMQALKKLAAEENINIECVVHNRKDDITYPFPKMFETTGTGMTSIYQYHCYLSVRATTSIDIDSSDDVNIENNSDNKFNNTISDVCKDNKSKNITPLLTSVEEEMEEKRKAEEKKRKEEEKEKEEKENRTVIASIIAICAMLSGFFIGFNLAFFIILVLSLIIACALIMD